MKKNLDNNIENQIKCGLKKTNYYQILQLKRHATQAQIKRSYKKMALKYHPDKNSAEGSKQLFNKIVQAYDTLSNQQKRQIYDLTKNIPQPKINEQYKNYGQQFKKAKQKFQRQKQYYSQFQKKYEQQAKKQREQQKQRQKADQNQHNKNQPQFSPNKDNNFKQKTSNRPSFYKYKSSIDEEVKFQKQKQKINARMYKVQVALFILALWIVLYVLGPSMKGTPYYSMNQTNQYKIKVETQILGVPFFVKSQYFNQAGDSTFKHNLQKKVDQIYIKGLSKVCNNALTKEEVTLQKLQKVKSKQIKKALRTQLNQLDKSSCDILHQLRQINPEYFLALFRLKNDL